MKLTPIKVKKYNKIAEKKPIMVRVDSKWYTWAEGDPKHGVFLTTQDGKDVEFDFNQIDDIKESVMKLTKSKLKEIVKEEIKLLSEKEAWPKYLKLLGHDARKFKKLDRHAHDYYMKAYKKSADAGEFEQNYSDDLERDITKIPIGEAVDAKKATEIRKKLLKRFGKDPLYKDFIVARTPKEQKKALDTLKSIRGSNAISLMQKYATSLQKESINEATKEKVYVLNDMLWLSYSPGSGQTSRITGRGYLTDKRGDKNYDSTVPKFVKWANSNKPIKKTKTQKIFKIPRYDRYDKDPAQYDIWGGDVKPKKYLYMLVASGKINVIAVFYSKAEAMSWVGHTKD